MASQNISEELVSKLTCTNELGLDGMIRNIPPAQISTIHRWSASSSLGLLDILPPELLLLTLNFLDFQSLSRISRVSLKGKAVVETLPAYREMMKHAPKILTALGKTGLLVHHSSSLLRQTLRSEKCVSCFDFGAFLFLPTCERVCFECLHQNHAFRMTTPAIAKRCFHLTHSQLKRIPIMHSIPGTYSVRFHVSCSPSCRLVSVKQAKQLAIEVHGSIEHLAPRTRSGKMPSREFWVFKHFHDAPLEPLGCDMSRLPEKSNITEDKFASMASIRIPYLAEAGADYGRLCRGCQVTYDHYWEGLLPTSVLSELAPPGVGPHRPLLAILARLRSRDRFLEHIRHCYGVNRLLADWRED
ncbi:hypothetical protein F4818DRAFT_221714 [Hypoxylon cercidicola]|nr:hypothetical protein F4818DRAFT_221714 [Hypoxylon cercidicola]